MRKSRKFENVKEGIICYVNRRPYIKKSVIKKPIIKQSVIKTKPIIKQSVIKTLFLNRKFGLKFI